MLYPDKSQVIETPGQDPVIPLVIVDPNRTMLPYDGDKDSVPLKLVHAKIGISVCCLICAMLTTDYYIPVKLFLHDV
jgi:hypothetical protein